MRTRAHLAAALALCALAVASSGLAETYCYNSITGSCVQMASIFDPCGGAVVTSCPGGPQPTPTPRPTTAPTPTPIPPTPIGATPTPAPPPPDPCCQGYEVTVPIDATPHTLNLWCGSLPCFATWPGGSTVGATGVADSRVVTCGPVCPPWTRLAVTINPTSSGAAIVYRAGWFSLAQQRCLSVPLLPSNIRADAR